MAIISQFLKLCNKLFLIECIYICLDLIYLMIINPVVFINLIQCMHQLLEPTMYPGN